MWYLCSNLQLASLRFSTADKSNKMSLKKVLATEKVTELIYAVDCAPGIELLSPDRLTNDVLSRDTLKENCVKVSNLSDVSYRFETHANIQSYVNYLLFSLTKYKVLIDVLTLFVFCSCVEVIPAVLNVVL